MRLFLPLAVLSVVAGWFGGPLVHSTSAPRSVPPRASGALTTTIGPLGLSVAGLRAKAAMLGEPVFWAGPANGARYEFERTTSDRLYVRYLPRGVRTGASGAHFLVVATYPFPWAYKALKRIARGKAVVGPGGSVIYQSPNDPKNVLLAFPRVPYEIEIYDPRPAFAKQLAVSGYVRPVG